MKDIMVVAAYIARRYKKEYNQAIDEMKLHKLMYFAQRESFIQNDEPLFDGIFYGWRCGPVLKQIRNACIDGYFDFDSYPEMELDAKDKKIFDNLFGNYAKKASMSLGRLTHGEISWQNSRRGASDYDICDNPLMLSDIKKDAERRKARRELVDAYNKAHSSK